jgi:hypothetical protein
MAQNLNFQKSRIVTFVVLDDETILGGYKEINIEMPNTITYTTATAYEKVHGVGLGEFNKGVVGKPIAYNFSFSVPSLSSSDRLLRTIMASKQTFYASFVDSHTEPADAEHKLYREGLIKCHINDMSTDYGVGDVPRTTFNGVALNEIFRTITKDGTTSEISNDATNPFGRGIQEGRDAFVQKFLDNPNTYW